MRIGGDFILGLTDMQACGMTPGLRVGYSKTPDTKPGAWALHCKSDWQSDLLSDLRINFRPAIRP